jgi:ketosteroid isomerase-like protein
MRPAAPETTTLIGSATALILRSQSHRALSDTEPVAEDADLELVKGIFRAWERGDYSSVEWAHPDISYDVPGPDREVRGIEQMSRAWIHWLQSYKDFRVEARSFHRAGDTIVVEQAFHGEGRASGIPLEEIVGAAAFTVRDGKVIRFRGYTNLPEALADAGIEPDA